MLVDWQYDCRGPGGYVAAMGYDISLTRAGIEPAWRVLDLWLWRSKRIGAGIGDSGPRGRNLIRGERGWQMIDELAPLPGELVIDKPTKGAFGLTDIDLVLRNRGITHLIFTGITTDVRGHTIMREANDRGYECLLLSDHTGATDYGNEQAAVKMVTIQGGVFGAVAPSAALIDALRPLAAGVDLH